MPLIGIRSIVSRDAVKSRSYRPKDNTVYKLERICMDKRPRLREKNYFLIKNIRNWDLRTHVLHGYCRCLELKFYETEMFCEIIDTRDRKSI